MLPLSGEAAGMLTRSWVMHTRVQSWIGDTFLADVPIVGGVEECDRSMNVPERLSLTVPAVVRGTVWEPTSRTHPLAASGQRLRVSVGIETAGGNVEWIDRGWFPILASSENNGTVNVEAAGVLTLLAEADLVTPYQSSAGTLISTAIRALTGSAIPVLTTRAPADRAVGAILTWDGDRLGAIHELLDAWPAEVLTQPGGYIEILPAAPGAPVLDLTDDDGGTVIEWGGDTSRSGAANVAVARGTASDGARIQGVAYDTDATSTTFYGGPFNPLPVPVTMDSQALTSLTQCRAAAAALLARTKRDGGRRLSAEIVPHPGLQLGDVVRVTGAGLTAHPCVIESLVLPLTPDGGAMSLSLAVV